MEILKTAKYFLLFFVVKMTFASDDIEMHPNMRLLPEECGLIDEDRILTNKPHLFEFPWMTLISIKNKNAGNLSDNNVRFRCDGTLINSRYVLTVAHCARLDVVGVRVGDFDINSKMDCVDDGSLICESNYQDIAVEESVVHPEYNARSILNDIALLRLKIPVDFGHPNVGAICLPATSDLINRNLSNAVGTLAGWKLLETPSTLQKTGATVYSDEDCKTIYSSLRPGRNISWPLNKLCVEGFKFLESGAPLMIKSDYRGSQKYVQYGIISTGKRDSATGIYTDVSKYMKWILDNIKP